MATPPPQENDLRIASAKLLQKHGLLLPEVRYRIDAKGRLIPVDQIKAMDIERSDLVERLIGGAKVLQQEMLAFKKLSFEDIAAFIQLSAEQHGVQIGGNKGNVTLFALMVLWA